MCIALRNLELKKFNPNGDNSPSAVIDGGVRPVGRRRTRRDPLRRETNADDYFSRISDSLNGDGDVYDANARWDRHRASMPKPIRSRMPRMSGNPDYSGYSGDWHGHLGYSTPGQGRRRSKPLGAMPRGGPGKIRRTGPQRPAFSGIRRR